MQRHLFRSRNSIQMLHYEAINPKAFTLLKEIMNDPSFNEFFLVGGTGLALQIGHRISDDLELFTHKPFDPLIQLPLLKNYGEVLVTGEAANTLNCFVDGIKIDMIGYFYPLISDLVHSDNIRLSGIPDIAAMKLSAIAQRGSKKDFFDLFELIKRYTLTELLGFFMQKFPSVDTFHIVRSLTWFEDAETEKDPRLLKKTTWKQVKTEIVRQVKEFSGH